MILSYPAILRFELPLIPTVRLYLYLAHSFSILHFKMHFYQSHLKKFLSQAIIMTHLSYCNIVPLCMDDCKIFRLMFLRKQLQS